ncbi:HAD hydrolase family protein [Phaeobacter inhibens]|uniref:HAD hydrolase family protein n=1 Tax=Phaeobacter inhibens TaxID=221822 RepID=UPI000C9B8C45|nr:HAD hydrolase family protein [Phaeobacter inhibens]AUQ68764.1 capsule biosynthesis phosphatase [Phaeobacter inhibens]
MKRIICDLDGTLTIDAPDVGYADKQPNLEVAATLIEYQRKGFEIVIATARNMRTYEGNTGKITRNTVPVILAWLEKHNIPCDELHIGKPWCGTEGFYVDDKAIRPNEFARMSHEEINDLLSITP